MIDTRRAARYSLIAGMILIGVAYASAFRRNGAPTWAPFLLALGIPITTVAVMVMGAVRRKSGLGLLAIPFVIVAVILGGGFLLALGLPADENTGSALYLGLPLRAAVVVYGIGLIPIVILPIAYALTFESQTLSEEDVRRARELGAAYKNQN